MELVKDVLIRHPASVLVTTKVINNASYQDALGQLTSSGDGLMAALMKGVGFVFVRQLGEGLAQCFLEELYPHKKIPPHQVVKLLQGRPDDSYHYVLAHTLLQMEVPLGCTYNIVKEVVIRNLIGLVLYPLHWLTTSAMLGGPTLRQVISMFVKKRKGGSGGKGKNPFMTLLFPMIFQGFSSECWRRVILIVEEIMVGIYKKKIQKEMEGGEECYDKVHLVWKKMMRVKIIGYMMRYPLMVRGMKQRFQVPFTWKESSQGIYLLGILEVLLHYPQLVVYFRKEAEGSP